MIKEHIKNFIFRDYNPFIFAAIIFTILGMSVLVSIRSLLLLIFVLLCSLIIIHDTYLSSTPLRKWNRNDRLDEIEHLILPNIDIFVKGACEGSVYSRERIHRDVRRWAIVRLAQNSDVSEKYIKSLIEDPEELKEFIQDDTIVKFLLSREGSIPKGIDYKVWVSKIIEKVEAWVR